ncbi:MAG TPA: sulfatase-like hydrolase/transferase [Rhodanobacteraceae bacterium]|nr:sulfatase-like hydrolase/transferase [Rhodanobacteraceae bacterium]
MRVPAFLKLRARRSLLLALGAGMLACTFWNGPLAEGTSAECLFAASVLGGMVLLAIALSGRLAFGLVAGSLPMLLLEIAANLKFKYLATPLLAPDLIYYFNRQILDTLLNYPFLIGAIVLALILVPLILIVAWRGDRQPPRGWRMRIIRGTAAAAGIAVLIVSMSPDGPFAAVHAKGMWLAMNDDSFVSDFLISFRSTRVVTPSYNLADAGRFDWRDDPSALESTRPKPDIVAVLEESTFDPRMLSVCTLPRVCDRRMFHPDANTVAHGWLEVHTWGGGTWTTEFAFLTGLSHDLFGPAGIYAPFNLAPRIRYTLPHVLHENGYRTVAIYPTDGDFLNGREAYADYGFDAFYGGEQVGLGWESTDADLMRVFRKVFAIEKAKAHGAPVFLFMLTLHQHGPHMTPLSQLPAPYDKPLFAGKAAQDKVLDDWLNLNLGNYLQRLSMSDAAEANLEAQLRADNRPALLLHFGDHQPSFDGAITALQKKLPPRISNPQVVTYYMLKGFGMAPLPHYDYPVLDIAFAGSLLLDAASLHKDAFFTANGLLRERCNGQYLDCRETEVLHSYRADVFGPLHDLAD